MSDVIKVDDLIVLGNAVPDELSDFRKSVCTAGYSPTYGLMRIYPVTPKVKMHRWHRIEVTLERNPRDVRHESWKIQGSRDEWPRLHNKIVVGEKLKRSEWIELLQKLQKEYGVDCVESLNEKKVSLGFIKPRSIKPYFNKRENYDNTKQTTLFGSEPFLTIHNYIYQPRLKYTCSNCRLVRRYHAQQIIEWGVYEWLRKHPNEIENVWKNLHIGESN